MKSASFEQKPFQTLKHRVTGRLATLSWNIVTDDPSSCLLFLHHKDFISYSHDLPSVTNKKQKQTQD